MKITIRLFDLWYYRDSYGHYWLAKSEPTIVRPDGGLYDPDEALISSIRARLGLPQLKINQAIAPDQTIWQYRYIRDDNTVPDGWTLVKPPTYQ